MFLPLTVLPVPLDGFTVPRAAAAALAEPQQWALGLCVLINTGLTPLTLINLKRNTWMVLVEENEKLCPTESQVLGFSPRLQLLPPPQHSAHRQLVPPRRPPVPPTWAVPTAWLSCLLPAPRSYSKDPLVRVKRLSLLFSLPVHEQNRVILPSLPTLFWKRAVLKPLGPVWPGCDLADPSPKQPEVPRDPVPAGASPHRPFGHPGAGDGRRDPGCRGRALAGRPPGQPQHELIKRHQRRSNLCLGGRSRKTHSSSQPSTVMASTLRDAKGTRPSQSG